MCRFSMMLICLCAATASAAQACPEGYQTLVSCTFEGGKKQVQTCMAGDRLTYEFGRRGQPPELSLNRSITEVDMYPWSGVSRSIWEDIGFENAGIWYRVFYSQERDPRSTEVSGGIRVEQGETLLAELFCDAGSVETAGYPLPVFDAKTAAGQQFNHLTYTWE